MTRYQRLFGTGPRGIIISIMLLACCWAMESSMGLPAVCDNTELRSSIFVASVILAGFISIWSFRAMPVHDRGRSLITTGAYRYFRHPLYASLISCFNFGLAIFLNNWIYVVWALCLQPIWHWNVRGEEALMRREFGEAYEVYCQRTGRFIPRLLPRCKSAP